MVCQWKVLGVYSFEDLCYEIMIIFNFIDVYVFFSMFLFDRVL